MQVLRIASVVGASLIVGACTEVIASGPREAVVEERAAVARSRRRRIAAAIPATSPTGVEVPWVLM